MEGALLGVSSRDYNTANSSSFIQQSDNLRTDATDMSKKTAIIIAIENNNVSAVKLLVEKGCRLANSANDVLGQTMVSRVPLPSSDAELVCSPPSSDAEQACPSPPCETEHICPSPSSDTDHDCPSPWSGTEHACPCPSTDSEGLCPSASSNCIPTCPLPWSDADQVYPPLLAAVTSHSIEIATLLLESGRARIDEGHKDVTPLIRACSEGLPDMVRLLLGHGADVNGWPVSDEDLDFKSELQREWKHRPLYHAVKQGHGKVVDILVSHGAKYICLAPLPGDSVMAEQRGWFSQTSQLQRCWGSILELAVLKCCSKVDLLLDVYRQDISSLDVYHSLVLAIRAKNVPVVKLLMEKYYLQPDCQILAQQELLDGYCSVICFAVKNCRSDEESISVLLLQTFGSLLAKVAPGRKISNLLFLAVAKNLPGTVAKLVEILTTHFDRKTLQSCPTAAIHMKDVRGTALCQGNIQILQTLHKAGLLDLHDPPDAICEALACGSKGADVYETLSWLVEQGLDPSSGIVYNMEPIHAAVKQQLPDAIDALCRLGADANARISTEDALSPLQMHLNLCILQLGVEPQVEIMKMLIRHGADLALKNGRGFTALSLLFWLMEASRQESPPRQAPLSPSFALASIRSMRCFPINAAFVPVDRAQAQAVAQGHEPADPTSAASGDDDSDDADQGDLDSESSATTPDSGNVSSASVGTAASSDPAAGSAYGISSGDTPSHPRIPMYLRHDRPQRAFIEAVVQKFGLELFSMGAAVLFGPMHWLSVDKSLRLAGIRLRHVPALKVMCWRTVRGSVGGVHFQHKVDQLPLPSSLRSYLKEF